MNVLEPDFLADLMRQAVEASCEHVAHGGLPFVGVLAGRAGVLSGFGVNRVRETQDPSAHAEIVAMREALAGGRELSGTTLLATGEPCGLCYRFAIDHGVAAIQVAIDRDAAAQWGFDYRASYPVFGIDDALRATLLHPLPVTGGSEPFARHLQLRSAPELPTSANNRPKGHHS